MNIHVQSLPLRIAITGGTSGLGLALVRAFVGRGDKVAFVARNASAVAAVAGETGAVGVVADVASKPDIHRVALQATATVYNVPANASWAMGGGTQNLAGTSCATGCTGTTSGSVIGRFVGTSLQGYAASFSVSNTQLNTSQASAAASVVTFARQ